jgi:ketosteroid isomerase-like protein
LFDWFATLLRRGRSRSRRVLLSETPALPVDHPLRPTLDERYLAMRRAMAHGNRDAILAMVTADFVSEDLDGRRIDGAAMADAVLRLTIDRSKRTAETTITAIDVSGDEATVVQRYAMTTTERRIGLPEALWTESIDCWRAETGSWRLARSTTQALEVQIAGRRRFRRRLDPHDGSVSIELRGPAR